MSDRFTLNISPEVLAKTFELPQIPQYEARYNIAPKQNISIVRHVGNQNKLVSLQWGMIPNGSKDNSQPFTTVSSETVNENPVFSHAIQHNRCIIPASGFYQWHDINTNNKHPYYVHLANSTVIGIAGLWDRWQAEDGHEIETCCIITTAANDIIHPIHERMPLILLPENYNLWLNNNMQDINELQKLYHPYTSDIMFAYPVPELVNNTRFDSASCIVRV